MDTEKDYGSRSFQHFDRQFFHFDPEGDGGGDGGGGDPGAESAPEGDPGGEEWTGPSQEEWQQLSSFQQEAGPVLKSLGELLQQPEGFQQFEMPQGGQEEAEEDEFDPFDPESVQSFISQNINNGIMQALGPFQGLLGTIASEKGEELAKGELGKIEQEVGNFDKDNAFLVASGLIEQGAEPAYALRRAAEFSRDFEKRIREDERKTYMDELKALSGAPPATPVGSSAAENVHRPDESLRGVDRYRSVIEGVLANNRPTLPVG